MPEQPAIFAYFFESVRWLDIPPHPSLSIAVGIAARRGTGVRSPRWCVRINEPFAVG